MSDSMKKYSKTHKLKIEPQYLERVRSGQKRFEIRQNDRDFQVGDWMHLQEIGGTAETACKIIYITNYAQKENYVVIGFTVGEEK